MLEKLLHPYTGDILLSQPKGGGNIFFRNGGTYQTARRHTLHESNLHCLRHLKLGSPFRTFKTEAACSSDGYVSTKLYGGTDSTVHLHTSKFTF